MKQTSKHLGFIRHLGDFRFKSWLDKNASEALVEMGVKAGHIVLDFGCGSGTFTIPAARLVGDEGRVYALDINTEALNRLEEKARREGLKNITRIANEGKRTPLKDGSIDLVLLIDVLQEIDDRVFLFEEAYRILKPDGRCSVYPMHILAGEVESLAVSKGLNLEDRKFEGQILIFRKFSNQKL
ncbi:class I SAM-dependent methyltransferase [Candidatus Bathyarchaeota archaeon]|nr:class I SAM-dependent methyltransferase [Candidatus Bathyarchaeota archaeon]